MKNIAFVFACMSVCIVACSNNYTEVPAPASNINNEMTITYSFPEAASQEPSPCPSDMKLVEGLYCPKVQETCLYYVDNKGNKIPPGKMPSQYGRCGEFLFPTRCLSEKRIYKKFCIDTFEIPNVKGQVPTSWMTYTDVENFCKSQGKRIATSSEWEFSCEGTGDSPRPYPYGSGYIRDRTACNTDNDIPKGIDVFKATSHNTEMAKKLDAMLVPSGSMERCISTTGVMDQIGNEDEYVKNETGKGYISGLKGGHIWGVRGRCRPMTTAHNGVSASIKGGAGFAWYETSGRCAKDAE
jgi:sulfatase modifying factor 1